MCVIKGYNRKNFIIKQRKKKTILPSSKESKHAPGFINMKFIKQFLILKQFRIYLFFTKVYKTYIHLQP